MVVGFGTALWLAESPLSAVRYYAAVTGSSMAAKA
jgi:hypothetical protein